MTTPYRSYMPRTGEAPANVPLVEPMGFVSPWGESDSILKDNCCSAYQSEEEEESFLGRLFTTDLRFFESD